jgi:hypothetical protein
MKSGNTMAERYKYLQFFFCKFRGSIGSVICAYFRNDNTTTNFSNS